MRLSSSAGSWFLSTCAAAAGLWLAPPASAQQAPASGPTTAPASVRALTPEEMRVLSQRPNEPPPPPPVAQVEGPMRVELMAILEQRINVLIAPQGNTPRPMFRAVFRMTGAQLGEVFRMGRLIIEEMSDDAGNALIDPATYSEKDRTETNPVSGWQGVLQQGYTMLDASGSPPARTSKNIKTVRGYVNIVRGVDEKEIVIENPLQSLGAEIKNDQLAAAGLKIRVLKPGEETEDPADAKGLALRIETGEDQVKSIDIHDDFLRKVSVRPRPGTAKDGKPYTFYALGPNVTLGPDHQLVIAAFAKVEKQKVEFSLSDVTLP